MRMTWAAQARALRSFEEYTFTHALNVSIVSMAMARHAGLPNAAVQVIALGALFHDVGKERVPLEIVNKPGKLTAEERESMNRHPAEGADIILSLEGDVDPLLPTVAYQHHMGVDLSGYPAPRWKTSPHRASLIVAVADIFDALRTIRPYRGALSEAQAISIILQDLQRGALERRSVAALLGALGALGAGRRVDHGGRRCGTVIAPGESDALQPLIETDEGEIIDMSDPAAPPLFGVLDREVAVGIAG